MLIKLIHRVMAIMTVTVVCASAQAVDFQSRVAKIEIPGLELKSFDIGAAMDGLYVLADRSHAAVDLVDLRTFHVLAQIGGFAGAQHEGRGGPNGVVFIDDRQVWAGDGASKIAVIDLKSHKVIATISTGGDRRVDELAYDAKDHWVIAVNNADKPPFVTMVDVRFPYQVHARISIPEATDGLEQPVWDPVTGLVYLAVPELNHQPEHGGIAVLDPKSGHLIRMIPVQDCMPAGLALGPEGHALVGCSDDAIKAGFKPKSIEIAVPSGRILHEIPNVGGSDEITFDPFTRHYVLAAVAQPGGSVIGLVDADSGHWLGNIPSGLHAHSVASWHGMMIVPVAAGDQRCPKGCLRILRDTSLKK